MGTISERYYTVLYTDFTHSFIIVLFHFQARLIPNPKHISHAPMNVGLPVQETGGQVTDQQLTQSAGHHVNLMHEPSNPHLQEDFDGEIIAVLDNYNGQFEVLVIIVESTPAIVDQL